MKKLKIYVLALFFFSFLKINAGTAIKFYLQKTTDKGMAISSVSPNFNSPDIYRFLPSDSLMMTVRASGHGSGMIDQLYFNDVLVFNGPALSSYKFIAKTGKYLITGHIMAESYISAGVLFYIENSLEVGIHEYINTTQWLTLFPNPSKESVTINSFEENLKTVAIYNVNSELIEFIETDANTLTIPLSQYPQGLYIVKVATLSDKIAIKKLIVQ